MVVETPVPIIRRIPALLVATPVLIAIAIALLAPAASLAPAAAGTGGDVLTQPAPSLDGAVTSEPAPDPPSDAASTTSAPASVPGPGDDIAPVPSSPATLSPSTTVSPSPSTVPAGPGTGSTAASTQPTTGVGGSTVSPSSDAAGQAPGGDGEAIPGVPGSRDRRDGPTSASLTSEDATGAGASPVLERQRTQARRDAPLTHADVVGLALTAVGLIAAGAGLLWTGRRQRGRYLA